MKKHIVIGLLLATLGTISLAGQIIDQMKTMTEKGRRNFTGMLIRQTGGQCPEVQRTFLQGMLDEKNAVWNVSCNSRDKYAIVFFDDGKNTTRVLKCDRVAELNVPACFKRF